MARGRSASRRRAGGDRRFRLALAIAFAVHLPFAPLRLFEWLRASMSGSVTDDNDPDAAVVVPIDLDLLARDIQPEAPTAVAVAPVAPPPAPTGSAPADAGAPPPRAPVRDAGPPPAVPDAGAKPLVDPTAAAGGAGKIAAKDANVQVLLAGNVLRRHEVGQRLSKLLVKIPEWRGFFKESPLDPLRDFNHVLITAPRLWGDSSKLVAVMDYNVPPAAARAAIDRVLHQTDGVWLPDAPVDAAKARVGGVPRLFAHLPERHLLVVLPADAMDQLERLKQAKPFRNSAEGVVVSMVTPARPFRNFLPLPETLKWLRVAFTPTADGGVDIAVELGDRSHEEAVAHAEVITREVDARRTIDAVLATVEIIDHVTFTASGDVIRGRTHVPRNKVDAILSWVEGQARQRLGP